MTAYEGVLGWQDAALCAQSDPELFFPTQGRNMGRQAKQICGACPVKRQCLEYAFAEGITEGIYGGASPLERARLKRDAA